MRLLRRMCHGGLTSFCIQRSVIAVGKPVAIMSPAELDAQLASIRNIAIVAHVDAGKTTTTERMLFYSGTQQRVGEVDQGTTTTDFMPEEIDRGVTIQSAVVTFDWLKHRINLIDTPGHVDFNIEVERCVRVLDGVVALFDAKVGVQAQSHTVLRQAQKFHTPVIAFLNKMDKFRVDFWAAVKSIQQKLHVAPLLLQIPFYDNLGDFSGVIDLVERRVVGFSGKHGATVASLEFAGQSEVVVQEALEKRHDMLSLLSSRDDELAEAFVESLDRFDGDERKAEDSLDCGLIHRAIRRQTIAPCGGAQQLVPILCGASRRDIGVQPLLDAIVRYLPSPLDRPPLHGFTFCGQRMLLPVPTSEASVNTLALAFKVMHRQKVSGGPLCPFVFFRVYCGRVTTGMLIYNTEKKKTEKLAKLFIMHAEETIEAGVISAGFIGAAFLEHTGTGDTLFFEGNVDKLHRETCSRLGQDISDASLFPQRVVSLEGICSAPPVLSYAILPASLEMMKNLEDALVKFQKEDPSLRVARNDHDQIVISGMGELHLEIAMSRMTREHGVECQFTRAIIEYRESINELSVFTNVRAEWNEFNVFETDFELHPLRGEDGFISKRENVLFVSSEDVKQRFISQLLSKLQSDGSSRLRKAAAMNEEKAAAAYESLCDCLSVALNDVLLMGPLAKLRVIGVKMLLLRFDLLVPNFDPVVVQAAARRMLQVALRKAKQKIFVEPLMELEVHLSSAEYIGDVMKDLADREPTELEIMEDCSSLTAIVPLRRVVRYSSIARRLAKGNVHFHSSLHGYRPAVSPDVKRQIFSELFR